MLGPSGHVDTFCRDNLPAAANWPDLINLPTYPDHVNAGVELSNALVAAGHGDRIALRGAEDVYTYGELAVWSDRIAQRLVDDLSLVSGNRVMVFGANTPALVAHWLGVFKAGGVVVAAMPMLRAGELCEIISKAAVSHVVCDARLVGEIDAAVAMSGRRISVLSFDARGREGGTGEADREPPRPAVAAPTGRDDVALIAFTSGSTGNPKAAMHFHRDILSMADGYARDVLAMSADDICIGTPPVAFAYGFCGLVAYPLRNAACAVLRDDLSVDALPQAIAHHRATVLFSGPTAYRKMLATGLSGANQSSLRVAVSAGETLTAQTQDAWTDAVRVPILDAIGSTEMLSFFLTNRIGDSIAGTTGRPVEGYEVRIVDEAMRTLPRNTRGRLAVRGLTGCRYLADGRQEETVRDGWTLTGDIFLEDDDGRFHCFGRADDIILSAGYNIAGAEVEAALASHAAVQECAVIGVPDDERGQIVEAVVVLNAGWHADDATAESLQAHTKEEIAPYKYPRSIRFADVLPKTPSGKIQRFRLRPSEDAASASGAA
ncbi:AMP-binding protein [Maritimibacter sp. UBA3975]|uniref:AMP-binding protein n=1 Tax=Maritimibacter sp. UBA3975 TaxID=1946833 RepID=UPI000C090F4F|nr:AMP-binding protein [Maritimibacter sp. UBA3975]MAM61403.1 2-aminobenzoate-CoA ligase [Maritimibacter sp.]|tara:strand:- start:69497 stop:71137 length:1641 start_codon:yes stop_codon:yes gene_type:complete